MFTNNKIIQNDILAHARMGFCCIEYIDNMEPKMYVDENFEYIFGISQNVVTPAEIYEYWYKNICPESVKNVDMGINRIKAGHSADFIYKWIKPGSETCFYIKADGVIDNTNIDNSIKIEILNTDISDFGNKEAAYKNRIAELELIEDKEITYAGIAEALGRDFDSIYYVNVLTGKYTKYSTSDENRTLNVSAEGEDFFSDISQIAKREVFIADLRRIEKFLKEVSDLNNLLSNNYFSIQFRMLIEGKPVHYVLSVVPSLKEDREHYIFGLRNIDEQVRQENEYKEKIRQSVELANKDPMTGVNNRLAYDKNEELIDGSINNGSANPFAVVLFDINGLKYTNDTYGHETGDELICDASKIICEHFKHSRVYRIGGDEFSAILTGNDYFKRNELIDEFRLKAKENTKIGGTVVASGIAEFSYDSDSSFSDVFRRADNNMYLNKSELKFQE